MTANPDHDLMEMIQRRGEMEDADERVCQEAMERERDIVWTPAATIAGIHAKAHVVRSQLEEDKVGAFGEFPLDADNCMACIVRDLLRLPDDTPWPAVRMILAAMLPPEERDWDSFPDAP